MRDGAINNTFKIIAGFFNRVRRAGFSLLATICRCTSHSSQPYRSAIVIVSNSCGGLAAMLRTDISPANAWAFDRRSPDDPPLARFPAGGVPLRKQLVRLTFAFVHRLLDPRLAGKSFEPRDRFRTVPLGIQFPEPKITHLIGENPVNALVYAANPNQTLSLYGRRIGRCLYASNVDIELEKWRPRFCVSIC